MFFLYILNRIISLEVYCSEIFFLIFSLSSSILICGFSKVNFFNAASIILLCPSYRRQALHIDLCILSCNLSFELNEMCSFFSINSVALKQDKNRKCIILFNMAFHLLIIFKPTVFYAITKFQFSSVHDLPHISRADFKFLTNFFRILFRIIFHFNYGIKLTGKMFKTII